MTIRFGVSPIAWINDDMPELGGGTPLQTVLADARGVGFSGIELGGSFPRDPAELAGLLGSYDLVLVGGWYSGSLLAQTAQEEIDALQSHMRLLEAMGSSVFIFAETSNAIHGQRGRPLSETPRLAADDWRRFGERITDVADYLAGRGFRFAYHHHLGTVVENAKDLDAFLAATGDNAGLTLDTGHAVLGGIDPVSVIRRHPARITHVHCKDVRNVAYRRLKAERGSFLDGVLAGMFTVPGDGDIAFGPLMEALAAVDYAGWIIVEAEQDPALANPRRYAELGLRSLAQEAATAGLRVEAEP